MVERNSNGVLSFGNRNFPRPYYTLYIQPVVNRPWAYDVIVLLVDPLVPVSANFSRAILGKVGKKVAARP